MKKVFLSLAVVAVAALAMTSCSKESSCYEVKAEWKAKSYSATAIADMASPEGVEHSYEAVTYVWNTPQGIKEQIANSKKETVAEGGYSIKVSKKKNSFDYKTCKESKGSFKVDGKEDLDL